MAIPFITTSFGVEDFSYGVSKYVAHGQSLSSSRKPFPKIPLKIFLPNKLPLNKVESWQLPSIIALTGWSDIASPDNTSPRGLGITSLP